MIGDLASFIFRGQAELEKVVGAVVGVDVVQCQGGHWQCALGGNGGGLVLGQGTKNEIGAIGHGLLVHGEDIVATGVVETQGRRLAVFLLLVEGGHNAFLQGLAGSLQCAGGWQQDGDLAGALTGGFFQSFQHLWHIVDGRVGAPLGTPLVQAGHLGIQIGNGVAVQLGQGQPATQVATAIVNGVGQIGVRQLHQQLPDHVVVVALIIIAE